MKNINDYKIEQLENKNYVVLTEGIYQDIDFINGGMITTEQRAIEIRDSMIEQANSTLTPQPTLEEKVKILENENGELKLALAETVEKQEIDKTELQLVIAQMVESNGGTI